jgi:uncharacterized protein (TIGR02588 family)
VSRPGDDEPRDGQGEISALEWVVAALGLLLVLATVGYLLVDGVRGGGERPRLTVRADSVVAMGPGTFVVAFTARNDGRATAAAVTILGELGEGADVEERRAELDFLPGRSERAGALVFGRDPRAAALRLRVEGWREP